MARAVTRPSGTKASVPGKGIDNAQALKSKFSRASGRAISGFRQSFASPTLAPSQRIFLQHRLLRALAVRSIYWVLALLVGSILTWCFGALRPNPPYGFTVSEWALGVWLLGPLPYVILLISALDLQETSRPAEIQRVKLCLCGWILLLSTWWFLGSIPLHFTKETESSTTFLTGQLFLFVSIGCQVVPLVLMSPSFLARLTILLTSLGAFIVAEMQQIPNKNFTRLVVIELTVFFVTAWILGLDERRSHVRALVAREALEKEQAALANEQKARGVANKALENAREALEKEQAALANEQKAREIAHEALENAREALEKEQAALANEQKARAIAHEALENARKALEKEQDALANEQEALEVAQAALEKLNTFVAGLSHDLRQPLAAIDSQLELMRETVDDPTVIAHAKLIKSQTIALNNMMESTLDLSLLQSGTWLVRPRELVLSTFITELAKSVEPKMLSSGIDFESYPLPYIVVTDAGALERILLNLLSNAIRYTPSGTDRGPGRIILRCEEIEQDRIIRISVEDNGIGIPEDKHKDIFEEFVQVSNPERNREKGFGLGLSIVRGLAELLGHKVALRSKVGVGSTFWIDVPYAARLPEAVPPPPEFQRRSGTLAGMVVALIEDDVGAREGLKAVLHAWGCTVIAGESGGDVIRSLEERSSAKERLSFIVCDYNLPDNEAGPQAIALVRDYVGAAVPAVIWTASTRSEILREIMEHDFERFKKPIDFDRLWTLLKEQQLSNALLSSTTEAI